MKDTVIKGAGNSRILGSVPNFLSLYPTYEDFAQALVMGTLPVDLSGPVASGCEVVGTSLNKASLLTDAVETAIWGSAANRTPNQALQQLRSLITTTQTNANGRATIKTGSYVGSGEMSKSLHIGSTPKFLMVTPIQGISFDIISASNMSKTGMIVIGGTVQYTPHAAGNILNLTWGSTVTWTTQRTITGVDAYDTLNYSGLTYLWLAIY